MFGQNPSELPITVKQVISAKAAPRQIAVLVEACNPGQLLSYDIVATQRNAFLRTKREDALALTKNIEEDNLRKFAEVSAAELNKASDAEHAQIEKIKTNVADGAPGGFGVVLLRTGSPNLCLAVAAKTASHRQLLLPDEGRTRSRDANGSRHKRHKHRRRIYQRSKATMWRRLRVGSRFEGADRSTHARRHAVYVFEPMEFAGRRRTRGGGAGRKGSSRQAGGNRTEAAKR